ncbi:hypothetical protein LCGC14_2010260, partial [marine sediment metagenome]
LRARRPLKTILVFARGGIGDTMWAMPATRALKEKHPTAAIMVVVEKKHMPIWKGVPYISGTSSDGFWNVTGFMMKADEAYDFGGIVTVDEKLIKNDPIISTFKIINLPLPKDRKKCRPMLVVTVDEGKRAEQMLADEGIKLADHKIITIGIESTTSNRNWPFEYTRRLTRALTDQGYKVIWLGSDKEKQKSAILSQSEEAGTLNLIANTHIRQAMALIALSDVYVGPSSGLLCIATALEIPSIGLWGAFDPKCRSVFYDKYTPLWGKEKCSPCGEHWTECRHGHPAPCMKRIGPGLVFNEVEKMLTRYPRSLESKQPIE